ncbi:hypothetical protein ABZP36_029458 [Zizania latifolia]
MCTLIFCYFTASKRHLTRHVIFFAMSSSSQKRGSPLRLRPRLAIAASALRLAHHRRRSRAYAEPAKSSAEAGEAAAHGRGGCGGAAWGLRWQGTGSSDGGVWGPA